MTEHAPAGSNPRMTQAQMKKYLANMEAAQKAAREKLDPEKENRERHKEITKLENELENIFWWEKTVKYYIGIDIGGSSIKYLLRHNDEIITSGSESTRTLKTNQDVLNLIFFIIDSIISQYENNEIEGIWVGSKGSITKDGMIASSSFQALAGLDLKNILQERYTLKVKVVNDASLPYYALNDSQKHEKNILCLTLWTGIGTAIFLKGKKIGDETFSSQFSSTLFKKGTHENYASVNFLLHKARENNITVDTPFELAKNKNDIMKDIFAEYWANIGEIIAKLIEDYNIGSIYISGWITKSKDLFEKDLQESLYRNSSLSPNIIIINENYEIGAYGASKLIEEDLLT